MLEELRKCFIGVVFEIVACRICSFLATQFVLLLVLIYHSGVDNLEQLAHQLREVNDLVEEQLGNSILLHLLDKPREVIHLRIGILWSHINARCRSV